MEPSEIWEVVEYIEHCYNLSHNWEQACLEGLHFAKFNFGEVTDSDKTWILRTARQNRVESSGANGI